MKIKPEECSRLRMVAGNEKKYPVVIDDGVLMEWVGIGWIDARIAIPADYDHYPEVQR